VLTKDIRLLLEIELDRAQRRRDEISNFLENAIFELEDTDSLDLGIAATILAVIHNSFQDKPLQELERAIDCSSGRLPAGIVASRRDYIPE